jgi:hypothetical protein
VAPVQPGETPRSADCRGGSSLVAGGLIETAVGTAAVTCGVGNSAGVIPS